MHIQAKTSRDVMRKWKSTGRRLMSLWRTPSPPIGPFKHPIILKPGKVTPKTTVPKEIKGPNYARTGQVPEGDIPHLPVVWTQEQIEGIKKYGLVIYHTDWGNATEGLHSRSCKIAREVLALVRPMARSGVTTDQIDSELHREIISRDSYPSTLNFAGFPKSISTSVNNVAVHGVPDDRPLVKGDLVSDKLLDIDIIWQFKMVLCFS